MSRLEASRTSEPLPPRPSALRPSPSSRKVVVKWGTRLGTTIATPMAVTPTTRPIATKALVGSARRPADDRGVAAPHERSERTPCRPTRASQHRAGGTAYQAPSPSPEFVADARKADSSGLTASTVPRLAGAGAV